MSRAQDPCSPQGGQSLPCQMAGGQGEPGGKAFLPGGPQLRAGSSLHPQGLDEDLQQEGTPLGQFTYDQDGEPIQTFYFQVRSLRSARRGDVLIFPSIRHMFSEYLPRARH